MWCKKTKGITFTISLGRLKRNPIKDAVSAKDVASYEILSWEIIVVVRKKD
jgi:hypothetical protein